jgi:phage anti-repressor protein
VKTTDQNNTPSQPIPESEVTFTEGNSVSTFLLCQFLRPKEGNVSWYESLVGLYPQEFGSRADGSSAVSLPMALGLLLNARSDFPKLACIVVVMNDGIFAEGENSPTVDEWLRMYSGLIADKNGLIAAWAVHRFLESKQPLGHWFTNHARDEKLKLGRDYFLNDGSTTSEKAGVTQLALTSETAISIAMSSESRRGKHVRNHYLNRHRILYPDGVDGMKSMFSFMSSSPSNF